MPKWNAAELPGSEEWEQIASELEYLDWFPKEHRAASGRHLARICTGNAEYSPLEQAAMLVDRAVATQTTWHDFGWPGLAEMHHALFAPPGARSPLTDECGRCHSSGLLSLTNGAAPSTDYPLRMRPRPPHHGRGARTLESIRLAPTAAADTAPRAAAAPRRNNHRAPDQTHNRRRR